mmetsp:Transcript_20981/g.63926  ORF Transcript_20981/g.63926 Transcript_20981/m.63926 type:complete len:227 (-) Transcript_20981:165-845(-)
MMQRQPQSSGACCTMDSITASMSVHAGFEGVGDVVMITVHMPPTRSARAATASSIAVGRVTARAFWLVAAVIAAAAATDSSAHLDGCMGGWLEGSVEIRDGREDYHQHHHRPWTRRARTHTRTHLFRKTSTSTTLPRNAASCGKPSMVAKSAFMVAGPSAFAAAIAIAAFRRSRTVAGDGGGEARARASRGLTSTKTADPGRVHGQPRAGPSDFATLDRREVKRSR